jgi:hypothetical protein
MNSKHTIKHILCTIGLVLVGSTLACGQVVTTVFTNPVATTPPTITATILPQSVVVQESPTLPASPAQSPVINLEMPTSASPTSFPVSTDPSAPPLQDALPETSVDLSKQYPIPIFAAPSDWLTYTNPNPVFEIRYPPDAHLSVKPDGSNRVLVSIPFESGTQLIGKSVEILASAAPAGCFSNISWQGVIQINGVDYEYDEGRFWDQNTSGQSVFHSVYHAEHNEYCYTVQLFMALQAYSDATPLPAPNSSDMDPEILLKILSTLRVP